MLADEYRNKIKKVVLSIARKYIREVVDECKKIVFPSRKDVYATSVYISVVVFITTIIMALTDFLISHMIKIIFGMGN